MKLLTVRQAGLRLGLSARRVLELIDIGRIPAIKPGMQYLIEEESLVGVKVHGKAGRPKKEKTAA